MAPDPAVSRAAQVSAVESAFLALQGKRILLVDDYALNQEVALGLLNRAGVEIGIAEDGRQALALLQRETFDAVLMDCQMPVMDGYEATRRIRGIERLRNLPVIALTAHAMEGDREKCLAAGMNDHIPKPVQGDELYLVLARWMQPSASATTNSAGPCVDQPVSSTDCRHSGDWKAYLEGIDVEAGLAIAMDKEVFYRKMLRIFFDTHAEFESSFFVAVAQGNTEVAQRMAHNLKNGAGTIGARSLHLAASALEASFKRAESVCQVESHVATVTRDLRSVLKGLRTLFAETGESPQ